VNLPELRHLLLAALLGVAGAVALAQPGHSVADASGPAWSSLSTQQRQVLAPLERDWTSLDASRRAKWVEVANRFPSMPDAERQRVQERMAAWARMSPAERGRARLNFQEAKQLTPEMRQQRWEAYQALPDERRRELAERAKPTVEAARNAPAPVAPLTAAQPKAAVTLPRSAASGPLVKPVAPTIVQAKPGATTTLMTRPPSPPAHQQPGEPKIAVTPDQVNRTTLLPRRGPQAAAASAPSKP
jgi:hypothetical protein